MHNTLRTALAVLLLAMTGSPAAEAAPLCFRGVNLAGAEYGEGIGTYGKDYIYPSEKTVAYFAAKGMDTIRLPFKWERLQPQLGARLDGAELQRLRDAVTLIRKHGMRIVLDPHNYAYYGGKQIGSRDVPSFAFAEFWARLSVEFAGEKDVVFGLMNEPHDIAASDWLVAANAAIRAIRTVGANNLVLVPGTAWTGAHSWAADRPGGSNATVMLGIEDPANNYAYEFHQYLDSDYSGTHTACDKAENAAAALLQVTDWLKTNGKRGFLGEFGAAANPQCLDGLENMLDVVAANGDVWLGWTYWAAGDWWPADEPMNVQPTADGDRRQLQVLTKAIHASDGDAACTGG